MTDEEFHAKTAEQAEYFGNRLKKRFKHLWKYAKRVQTTAFRVYHRDIPELPFAVDWYDGHLHVAEYARPHDRSPEQDDAWRAAMLDTAARALTVPRERVFLKRRERQKGGDQYEPLDRRGYTIDVEEQGLLFRVNLSDYIDTGLFLDHRELRLHVARRCNGKRFLNLFGYTGSFTVYAAAGGARSTLTLDLSNTYLEWARENLKINGLLGPEHEYRRVDVLRELAALREQGRRFDVIVLDPPSFSNSKNMDRTFDVQRDHLEVIDACLELLEPGGELFFSTNRKKFNFRRQELLDAALRRAGGPARQGRPTGGGAPGDRTAGGRAGGRTGGAARNNRAANDALEIRRITKLTMPEDFASTNIHQVWSLVRKR